MVAGIDQAGEGEHHQDEDHSAGGAGANSGEDLRAVTATQEAGEANGRMAGR